MWHIFGWGEAPEWPDDSTKAKPQNADDRWARPLDAPSRCPCRTNGSALLMAYCRND